MFWQAVNAKITASAAAANTILWVVLRDILTSLLSNAHAREKDKNLFINEASLKVKKNPCTRRRHSGPRGAAQLVRTMSRRGVPAKPNSWRRDSRKYFS